MNVQRAVGRPPLAAVLPGDRNERPRKELVDVDDPPAGDQRDRMRLMRGIVREFNVYRWAGRMLLDAAVMRQRSRYGATDVAVGRI